MSETRTLELVLADARGEAAVLRSHGHQAQARSVEALADQVTDAMRSYLTILSESEAMLRSNWSVERLRRQFPGWEAQGFAMLDERGRRRYRQIIVPARDDLAAARRAGEEGGSLRAG